MKASSWLAEPLPRAVALALERLAAAPGVAHVAVMPDVHLADHVCVGTVLATADQIYPQAAGGDLGCGIAAVRLQADATAFADAATAARVLAAWRAAVPAVRRPKPVEVAPLPLADPRLWTRLRRDVAVEFGTLGRGNHFLEVQSDEHGGLWLTVHTGSRALGPAVRDHHLARGTPVAADLVALPAAGAGAEYLHDAGLAVAFAEANRRAVAEAAVAALGEVLGITADWSTWFGGCHDFVRCERHGDRDLFVHRKGANSARSGESAVIPGSMGTRTFHVEGRGHPASLASCAHGAGRALPRGEARRRIAPRQLLASLRGVHFERHLADRLLDEAPDAYKDIGAVMRAQRELVRIVRTLHPLLVYKAV